MDDIKVLESKMSKMPEICEKDADEETNDEIKQVELKQRMRKTIVSETIKLMSRLTGSELMKPCCIVE